MKSRDISFRLKRFEAEEKRRKVDDLQHMIREFEHMAVELDRQVQSEEDRTGIKDRQHFAYSTVAKAAALRRDNLRNSVAALQIKLEAAIRERDDACANMDKAAPEERREVDRPTRRSERRTNFTLR